MENLERKEQLSRVLNELDSTLEWEYRYFRNRSVIIPSRKEIIVIIKNLQQLMFPDYFKVEENSGKGSANVLSETYEMLKSELLAAFAFCSD